MREIKFRAWDGEKMDRRWKDGRLVIDASTGEAQKVGYGSTPFNVTILQNLIVMQYTGLKDKNGVEIYEGDILQRPSSINSDYHGEWIRDEVIHKPGQWFNSHVSSEKGKLPRGYTAGPLLDSYFDYDGNLYAFGEDYQPLCIGEVIGNIYESPELLKEAKK